MDVVMIPLVQPSAEVAWLLDVMRRVERAGAVVHHAGEDRYHLLHAGDILRARAKEVTKVAGVWGGYPVLLVDAEAAQVFALDLVRPEMTYESYEAMLLQRNAQYALVGASADMAMIVTLHEKQGATLTGTGGYECSGAPTHYFPEPRVVVGKSCPMYPECSEPSGAVPTIRPA